MSRLFRFHVPVDVFSLQKSGTPNGRQMRIGGVVSTEDTDQQGETILSTALDFSRFEKRGYFNDNHDKTTSGVVGVPDVGVKLYRKGQRLPNGTRAHSTCWWAEGVLVGKKGREIWQLALDLRGTDRALGFSVEGRTLERDSIDERIITRAIVKHIAITHCPVNAGTELQMLSKALSAGSAIANPGAHPGSGFAFRTESLDPETKILTYASPLTPPKRKQRKGLSKAQAVRLLMRKYPAMDAQAASGLYDTSRELKKAGLV